MWALAIAFTEGPHFAIDAEIFMSWRNLEDPPLHGEHFCESRLLMNEGGRLNAPLDGEAPHSTAKYLTPSVVPSRDKY